MSKDEAMSRLALCCKLTGRDDSFEIMSKGSPFQTYGGIRFAKGEVVSVTRDVAQFQEGASVKLAQALYRELSEMSTANGQNVRLRISETEGTDVTIRYVTLSFPNGRSVAIEINKVDSVPNMTDWVDVKEYLEKP